MTWLEIPEQRGCEYRSDPIFSLHYFVLVVNILFDAVVAFVAAEDSFTVGDTDPNLVSFGAAVGPTAVSTRNHSNVASAPTATTT